jgi:hypothetical protein
MKVFALAPNENWIVDRMVAEWNADNHDIATTNPHAADVIWLIADWCWRRVPMALLETKHVVTTIHHIVPEKFGYDAQVDFAMRDGITDVYHVPNEYTRNFVKQFTKKRVEVISYWANSKLWFRSEENKYQLRQKLGVPVNAYLIGSFQRDTEGSTAESENPMPKLEKGPDILADAIETIHRAKIAECEFWSAGRMGCGTPCIELPHVVLAGWRRQYLIKRLEAAGVPYTYIENPPLSVVRELYQTLDLYPITARYEGGPQSLIECGLLGVPTVSRPIGIATMVLPFSAINEDVTKAIPAVPSVSHLITPEGYGKYRELFEEIANG